MVELFCQNEKIKRALAEGKILLTKKHLALSAQEKIRGDTWATEFISLLETN